MPELPEVETVRNDLKVAIVGHQINDVNFLWQGILKEMDTATFKKIVCGSKITDVRRRAKNLAIEINRDLILLIHLKMTGHLIVTTNDWKVDNAGRWVTTNNTDSPLKDPLNQYIRMIFYLDKGKIVAFSDLRKFAYIKLISKKDYQEIEKKYGPEPLTSDFNLSFLQGVFKKKSVAIKKVIMDQGIIAGIGNIYADEILWATGIHPMRKASSLNKEEIENFIKNTKRILSLSIKNRGTSTSDFRDTNGQKGSFGNYLSVYQKTNLPCPKDGTIIKRISVGGRGTHFCPKCQVE